MLYSADQLGNSFMDSALSLLENANYLSEEESRYYPEMVPIRENQRIGRNVIRVEDFVEYALSNGINDGGYAFGQICEASNVDPQSVAFSVDEVSILEDSEMEDTVRELMQAGAEVYAVPISENDMAYIMAEAVCDISIEGIAQDVEEYTDALFEAFIEDDFETFFNEDVVLETIAEKIDNVNSNFKNRLSSNYYLSEGKGSELINSGKEKGKAVLHKIESIVQSAKNKSRHWLAKKVSSLRTLLDRFSYKLNSTEESTVRRIFRKIVDKIKQALRYLEEKLTQAKNYVQDKWHNFRK